MIFLCLYFCLFPEYHNLMGFLKEKSIEALVPLKPAYPRSFLLLRWYKCNLQQFAKNAIKSVHISLWFQQPLPRWTDLHWDSLDLPSLPDSGVAVCPETSNFLWFQLLLLFSLSNFTLLSGWKWRLSGSTCWNGNQNFQGLLQHWRCREWDGWIWNFVKRSGLLIFVCTLDRGGN